MKKWLTGIVICLLLLTACCYFIIPSQVIIQNNIITQANPNGLQRTILDDKKWEKWWPGQIEKANGHTVFSYNGFTYTLIEKRLSSLVFTISDKSSTTTALLHFITLGPDSILLSWETKMTTSVMPIKRVRSYFKSRQINSDQKILLDRAQSFYSNSDNIYDIHIERSQVRDSTLLFTFASSKGLPGTEFIYGLIDQLKNYAADQSAKVTGYSMLNISTIDSIHFLTKVAVPIDKKLKPSGNISYKWMLGGGKILVAEVQGGPASINKALKQVEVYVQDYHLIAPAIPFQSLITDRTKEKDTSKWITKIYYPVM